MSFILHFNCNIILGSITSVLFKILAFSIILPPLGLRPLFLGVVTLTGFFGFLPRFFGSDLSEDIIK